MKVEIYSDIACPWCYIGKRRFEQALDGFAGKENVEVVYRPYQLVPDAPATASPHREWLAERYGPQSVAMDARVAELGRAEGIGYDFDAALHANTFLGHRLLHLAETEYGAAAQGLPRRPCSRRTSATAWTSATAPRSPRSRSARAWTATG